MRPVLLTGDIFRLQSRGGITRYVVETVRRLRRPARVIGGLHRSVEAGGLGPSLTCDVRIATFPGSGRLMGVVNAAVDAWVMRRERRAILHPTYYRDPASIPRDSPLVITVHDLTHELYPALARLGPERWKRTLARRAERIVCYSESARRDCIEHLGTSPERIRVAPLASRDWSEVAALEPNEALKPYVLWVGERWGYKNFAGALFGFARCATSDGLNLLCIGGGPLTDQESSLAGSAGVLDRVVQCSAADGELRFAYENARALLYPSLSEGFGLPVVEAMSLGCPVVTSNRSSLPEVGGNVAHYAEPEDPDSIAEALAQALAEDRTPARAAELRAQAARFSWERCAAIHDALYEELD